MEAHQQRVVNEATELREKTKKLQAFFSNEIFKRLEGTDSRITYCPARSNGIL